MRKWEWYFPQHDSKLVCHPFQEKNSSTSICSNKKTCLRDTLYLLELKWNCIHRVRVVVLVVVLNREGRKQDFFVLLFFFWLFLWGNINQLTFSETIMGWISSRKTWKSLGVHMWRQKQTKLLDRVQTSVNCLVSTEREKKHHHHAAAYD